MPGPKFLFENQSPAHIYYRWKLYSMLQGDIQNKWRTSEFRMFKGGSIWRPPPMNPYTQGMPEELVEPEVEPRKGSLSPTQRDRLEDLIRNMTPERLKVAEVMVFCMEHSEAAEEICDCILESLSNPSTALYKKIARLYLISDILHNCGVKITNASYYRRGLEARLIPIFTEIHQTYKSIESRMKAEGFRMRVMKIFQAWEDWAVYSKDFLIRIQNAFLGLTSDAVEEAGSESEEEQGLGEVEQEVEDPEDNEDLDGVPLDGAALLKGALNHQAHDDIDGVPMVEEDIDGMPMDAGSEGEGKSGQGRGETRTAGPGFVMSRWETVDPDLVEAQAMTTSKWETLEQTNHSQEDSQEEDTSNLDLRLEARLIPIFTEIHQTYKSIESRMKAEGFRMRVMKIFQAWEDWAVYSKDFLIRIQNAFLGLTSDAVEEAGSESEEEQGLGEVEQEVEDPEDNEDLDGVPLDGAALLKGALNHQAHDDIDGVPMVEEDIDGMPMDAGSEGEGKSGQGRGETRTAGPGFVMSRWETVDPDLVEAQAMTTSKWETLEQTNHSQEDSQEEDTSNLDLR
ncbi:U2 snRNP-associated SURP domain-containing protein [Homalodisca vitripennis]|nr:U2 snRNP-associated SURP domain-containing protein [Homalodisca vitripennis]